MKFSVLTLFPQLIEPWLREAIIGKAVQRGLLEFDLRDIRSVATDRHRTVDDSPYGGGAGMVMRVDIIAKALAGIAADEVHGGHGGGHRGDHGGGEGQPREDLQVQCLPHRRRAGLARRPHDNRMNGGRFKSPYPRARRPMRYRCCRRCFDG